MNQIKEWDGTCQRCMNKSVEHTMSLFDVSLICLTCSKREDEAYRSEVINKPANLDSTKSKKS